MIIFSEWHAAMLALYFDSMVYNFSVSRDQFEDQAWGALCWGPQRAVQIRSVDTISV